MSARLVLTAQAEDLVCLFATELADAGVTAWPSTLGGARAFSARYRTPATFSALPLAQQLALPAHQRAFVKYRV